MLLMTSFWQSSPAGVSQLEGTAQVFWQSSPAGVSPGLLALDLACASPWASVPDEVFPLRDLPSQGDDDSPVCRGKTDGFMDWAQARSRASSPGETPAGDDCQKTRAAPSSWETPAGDDYQR